MDEQINETKILYNVLTGGIKILSANGRFEYCRISDSDTSMEDRIKYTIGLLKIIKKLKSRRTILANARQRLIEAQIYSRRIETQ